MDKEILQAIWLRREAELLHVVKEMEKALEDIAMFHEKDFNKLEEKYGFLGWTCCGHKEKIAKKSLSLAREVLKT